VFGESHSVSQSVSTSQAVSQSFYTGGGGANSKNICFGRTAKFIRESEDIAGNREPREIILETANNIAYYVIYLGLAANFVLSSGDVSFCLSMVNRKL